MMKWKVVKNPRSASADRSLECQKSDVQQSAPQNNVNNDSNNNIGEESKPDNVQPLKETNKQRESSLVRKPSVTATECINLKSILGLTRQRSETNLSCIGLIGSESRRSRSEVRGVSCDRLTVGYHTAPGNHLINGKTRSSSPPSRSGWLRGRKRERESRNPVKNNLDAFGKTVVTGSHRKRTSSKSRNGDCRTIVDGSDSKQKNKLCPSEKSSFETRKCKGSRRSGDEDIIEEEIYTEINQDNVRGKLLEENNKDAAFKDPNRVIRKKGLAPKPQIMTALFKETNCDVNFYPNGCKAGGSSISLNEVPHAPPNRKPPRKNQTFSCRNQDRRSESRAVHSVKMNNLKNSESALVKIKNNINVQSVVAVAEIHDESPPLNLDNENKKTVPDLGESPKSTDVGTSDKCLPELLGDVNEGGEVEKDELLPFHIDTPDYSTLESANCNSLSLSTEDILNCNTDCEESLQDSQMSSDNARVSREISLSSILRDSTFENKTDSEPKKTVRFEKLDLIEKYKKHKTESCMDTEDDTDVSVCEDRSPLDVNSNEIDSHTSLPEDMSQCPDKQGGDESHGMTVNVVVRSPSPAAQDTQNEEFPTPFVVKKSFVLTIAKQENGFRSLCANKKLEPVIPEPPPTPTKADQQISVTFLCSGPHSEPWVPPERLRSTSVPPPNSFQPADLVAALPAIRGRSRERKSKERQHCKKNHKARKKDAVFVMPQAVIDELSQVLEKRKPSLDEIPVHP